MSNIFTYLTRDTGGLVPLNTGAGPIDSPHPSQGLNLDEAGNIHAVVDGTPAHYHSGLPFDVDGRLCATGNAAVRVDQSIPFAANGSVAFSSDTTGAHYDQGLLYSGGALGAFTSVTLQTWVPNLIGSQYGQLDTVWQPSGAEWGVDSVTFLDNILTGEGIWSFGNSLDDTDSMWFRQTVGGGGFLQATGANPGTVSGGSLAGYHENEADNISFPYGDFSAYNRTSFGAYGRTVEENFITGQIHDITLTDPLDSELGLPRDVVELDGVNQYGEIPAFDTQDLEIECYIVLPNFLDNHTALWFGENTNRLGFGISGATLYLYLNNGSATPAGTFVLGQVYKINITYNDSFVEMFVNGVSTTGPLTVTSPYVANTGSIGVLTGGADYWDGWIANLSLTDNTTPSNSRFYPMDSLELIDTLHPDSGQPELVVNGTFDTNLDNWAIVDQGTGGSASWDSGQIKLVRGDGGNTEARQTISTVTGNACTLKFSVKVGSQNSRKVTIGSQDITGWLPDAGEYEFTFTPLIDNEVLSLIQGGAIGHTGWFDNVSVKETTTGTWFNNPTLQELTPNTLNLDFTIKAAQMPSAANTGIYDQDGNDVGEWIGLDASQPWVPLLKGGAPDGSNAADKSMQYNGDFTDGSGFSLGVNTTLGSISASQSSGAVGSWSAAITLDDICVAANGAVIKITFVQSANVVDYVGGVLQGNDEQIQNGLQYPMTFRVIKSTDTSGEWAYLNGGGIPPWSP